ncbi:MAG: ABC transporter ATP-binding protein [bacterium]
MRLLIFARDIFKKFYHYLIVNIFFLLTTNLVEAMSIFMLAPIMDYIIHQNLEGASNVTQKIVAMMRSLNIPISIWTLFGLFLLLNMCKSGFHILGTYTIQMTKYAMIRDLMLGTFDDFFKARWFFFSSAQQGKLLNTFTRELRTVGDGFGAMARFVAIILQLIFYLAVPFYISWQVTLFSLFAAVLFALPFIFFNKVSYNLGKKNTLTSNRMISIIQESLGSAKTILSFANQRKSSENLKDAFEDHRIATIKSQVLNDAIPQLYLPLCIVVLIIAMFTARELALPIAELTVLMYALLKAIPIVGQIAQAKNLIDNFFPSYEQIVTLRDEATRLRQKSGIIPFKGLQREIIMKNLFFSYPGHEPVVSNINISIPKGKMIAIVGESGSGKSTLVDLIMGFHEPHEGEILIDDISLHQLDIQSYRRHIGYISQESILFNMSIRDNLSWAKKDASDEELRMACRQAHADDFINDFPARYDSIVGDRGVRLSGGQIQRIALARGILIDPDILILDEATSSLDTHSERLIQQAIENISKKRTVIAIAHRLSTIVNANYIYVVKKGHIVEQGTYAELVKRQGYFYTMLQLQNVTN